MKHILMVDDNTTNLKVAAQVLQPFYQLSMAKSGKQALNFLKKNKPDLILLDVKMPDMDGYETLAEIKLNQEVSNIPVIFLTASTDMDSEIKGMQMGALDYITKPFEEQVMLSRIEKVLQMDEMRRNFTINEFSSKNNANNDEEFISLSQLEDAFNNNVIKSEVCLMIVEFEGIFSNSVDCEKYASAFCGKLEDYVGEIYATNRDKSIVAFYPVSSELSIERILEYAATECCQLTNNTLSVNITCNVSAAVSGIKYRDYNTVYTMADKALYHVKKTNGLNYHLYEE